MKKHILTAALSLITLNALAATDAEILKIRLTDGSETAIAVSDIAEMTFEVEAAEPASLFAGAYTGTQSVTVGGMYTYTTTVTYTLTAEADGSLTVDIPEYSLSNTMMGDLTLGKLTIKELTYDEATGAFSRNYAADGLTQHFLAVNGGNTVFDKDYTLGGESTITITLTEGGIHVENPFKLGAMPLSLTATFDGVKK